MFLSVRHKPHQKEAVHTAVYDRDTGEKIPRVVWADDIKGRYRQCLVDAEGKFIVECGRVKSKIFKGNIELRRVA
jgi:hypothetical protein